MRHFSITFGSQNDQFNHLPPTDLKSLNHLASSEFFRHYTEKNKSHISYPFLDLTIRKLHYKADRQTDRHIY